MKLTTYRRTGNIPKLINDPCYQAKKQKKGFRNISLKRKEYKLKRIINGLKIGENVLEHDVFNKLFGEIKKNSPSIEEKWFYDMLSYILVRVVMIDQNASWLYKYKPLHSTHLLNREGFESVKKRLFDLTLNNLGQRKALVLLSNKLKGKNSIIESFCYEYNYKQEIIDFADYKNIGEISSVYKYSTKFKDIAMTFDGRKEPKQKKPIYNSEKSSVTENEQRDKEKCRRESLENKIEKLSNIPTSDNFDVMTVTEEDNNKDKGTIDGFFSFGNKNRKKQKDSIFFDDKTEIKKDITDFFNCRIVDESEEKKKTFFKKESIIDLLKKRSFENDFKYSKTTLPMVNSDSKRKKLFIFKNLNYLFKNRFLEDKKSFAKEIINLMKFIKDCEYPAVLIGDKQDKMVFEPVLNRLSFMELDDYILGDIYSEKLLAFLSMILCIEFIFNDIRKEIGFHKSLDSFIIEKEVKDKFQNACTLVISLLNKRKERLDMTNQTLYVKEQMNLYQDNIIKLMNQINFEFKTGGINAKQVSNTHIDYVYGRSQYLKSHIENLIISTVEQNKYFFHRNSFISRISRLKTDKKVSQKLLTDFLNKNDNNKPESIFKIGSDKKKESKKQKNSFKTLKDYFTNPIAHSDSKTNNNEEEEIENYQLVYNKDDSDIQNKLTLQYDKLMKQMYILGNDSSLPHNTFEYEILFYDPMFPIKLEDLDRFLSKTIEADYLDNKSKLAHDLLSTFSSVDTQFNRSKANFLYIPNRDFDGISDYLRFCG